MPRDYRYKIFEKALIAARLEHNFTQKEVAVRLKKPQSYVSKYENGERRLDIIEFIDICKALGKSVYEVLNKFYREDNEHIKK